MSAVLLKLLSRFLYCLPKRVFNSLVIFATFLVSKVFRYRRNVIFHNLHFIFPEKSKQELTQIANKFYFFVTDMALNSLKSLTEPTEDATQRIKFFKTDVFKKYEDAGQSIIIMGGHHYNWEAGCGFAQKMRYQCIYLYKPLKSKSIDNLLKKSRGQCGGILASGKEIIKYLKLGQKKPYCYIFVSDQHAPSSAAQVPVNFFNQQVNFIAGPEKFAKKLNYPVFYGSIEPATNGQCEAKFTLLSDAPQDTPDGEITQKAASMLEEQIKHEPWFWLLSHKRFKDYIDYRKPCPI